MNLQGYEITLDDIGKWSERKLEILKKYCEAYTTILSKQIYSFQYVYIDGFSGAGLHKSKETGELIQGSPLNVISLKQPFKRYYFVEIDEGKFKHLKKLIGEQDNVHYYFGDCNKVLINEIFPKIDYTTYKRAFCLLDPYNLQLNWNVIKAAADAKSIEVMINFPIMDINRNVLRRNESVSENNKTKMITFWGDDTWQNTLYPSDDLDLFGHKYKASNEQIVEEFMKRLINIAGFKYVSNPLPMKNSTNSIVYYLIFASQKQKAVKIINDIFKKY